MVTTRIKRLTALGGFLLFVASPSFAALGVTTRAGSSESISGSSDSKTANSAVSVTAENVVGASGANSSAFADWGVLKVNGTAFESNYDPAPASAGSTAGWSESVHFTSSENISSGAYITLRASILIDGSLSNSKGGTYNDALSFAGFAFQAYGCGGCGGGFRVDQGNRDNLYYGGNSVHYNNQTSSRSSMFDIYEFDIVMISTAPITFDGFLNASAEAKSFGGPASSSNYSGLGVYWGGITSATTGGRAITNFGVTGSSGHDWTKTSVVTNVPEPESYAMMIAGLGVIGAISRRRKANLTA